MSAIKLICFVERIATKTISRRSDPFSDMAEMAFKKAIDEVIKLGIAPDEIALYISNSHGGWQFSAREMQNLIARGPRSVSPFQAIAWFPAAAQGNITINNNLKIPALTFSSDVRGAIDALWMADFSLRRQDRSAAVVIATEGYGSDYLRRVLDKDKAEDVVACFLVTRNNGVEFCVRFEQSEHIRARDSTNAVSSLYFSLHKLIAAGRGYDRTDGVASISFVNQTLTITRFA